MAGNTSSVRRLLTLCSPSCGVGRSSVARQSPSSHPSSRRGRVRLLLLPQGGRCDIAQRRDASSRTRVAAHRLLRAGDLQQWRLCAEARVDSFRSTCAVDRHDADAEARAPLLERRNKIPGMSSASRPLVQWRSGCIEYRIERGNLGRLLLVARGPGGKRRATALNPMKQLIARVGPLDSAQRATTGWRGVTSRERTRLAELLLKQSWGVLRQLT